MVLEATIQDLNLPIQEKDFFYENVVELIDNNMLNIDVLLNVLILNNMASINKTLQFND